MSLTFLFGCEKDKEEEVTDCSKVSATYNSHVKGIISSNCTSSGCHNSGSANGDFTTYEGLKKVADKGTLKDRVINNKTMPPTSPLPKADIEKIECWISSGVQNN